MQSESSINLRGRSRTRRMFGRQYVEYETGLTSEREVHDAKRHAREEGYEAVMAQADGTGYTVWAAATA